ETGPAISKEVFNANSWDKEYAPVFLDVLMDSLEMPLDDKMSFTFEDMAGNSSVYNNWTFVIAPEDDIPVVHIILPLEDEVITSDFVVSGVMFDDDGIKGATWSLNGGPWQEIDAENGFSIPIPLSAVHDNENYISVIAEDVYGVKSEPVTRNFRVSLEEPKAQILFPLVDTVLRDVIEISGVASDKNGIKEVQISIDNGNSFNKATGAEEWAYSFNTKILRDGPHVVFIRVFDNYDIPATYASMINIDNTPPDIALDSPDDGSISIGRLNVMGRALDPNLESITIEIKSLTGQNVRSDLRSRTVPPTAIIRETFDLVGQADGHYNMEVIGVDRAGNITRVSRNFELARETYKNYVEVLYPLDNEVMRGEFYLYGFAGGVDPAEEVTIRVNGRDVESVEVDASGYYRFSMNAEHFSADINEVIVHSNFGGGETVLSKAQNIVYSPSGPWVTIDSFNFGDFAYERPYVFGRVGYILSEEDQEVLADRKADRELRAEIQKKVPDYTEISFDNGKTFFRTNKALAKGIDYRYRLETGDMIEGMHYIFIRSTMKNGETAITRMLVQVDKTPPVIRLISPEAGEAYNTAINYSASASDDVELVSLTYHLRAGDKAAYEIPGFLQGLYFEAIIPPFIRQITNEAPAVPFGGGATYMDIGFGLSFFDDNVKIQANYGWQTNDTWMSLGGEDGQLRYGGDVFGFKLLANIYTLPFGAIAGPDWEWLSASFGLGANFSLFSIAQSGSETWLSALLLQIEFPKMTIPKQKAFRTYSFFTEGQLWFVPTDVDAEANEIPVVLPKVVIGFRIYVF
ncbi:MAG: neuraminidase, partial [Treponema sp.]|nr:neuraminidase [Treponema sp.]